MLPDIRDYDRLRGAFRWNIPARYNIGVDVCDRWALAEPERIAIIEAGPDNGLTPVSYARLRDQSNRLANALRNAGIGIGERVAIMLPQCHQAAVAHIATYKLGSIALPIAGVFGVDAISYRLQNAGVSAVITNAAGVAKLHGIAPPPATLKLILSIDGDDGAVRDYTKALAREQPDFQPVDSRADDPAVMIYTSGTTGNPKGALHAHRVLLGHLPGVQMPHDFLPQPGDRLWTPADWSWIGGLLDILLPGLHFGVPVVARKFDKFDPDEALRLMQDAKIRNTFIPPTALRMLRTVKNPRGKYDLSLRTIASGGESLGEPTLTWGREAFGLTINEFYGQTECNLVVSSCGAMGISEPGVIGKAVPGHHVAIIGADGSPCGPGELGQIAVQRPDPVMFLGYWNNAVATQEKFIGDWLITGDQGTADEKGFIRFVGRDDDIITSAGYRIGPAEIEDCLIRHPAVALAAAVGKPDALRTEIVKAFVVLKQGHQPSPALKEGIQKFVRERLSAHEYPREIEFVDTLPLTTTGKVIRRLLREKM